MVLCTGGCKAPPSNNKGKIEGTQWTSQPVTINGRTFPADAYKLDFRQDGTLVCQTPRGTWTGTYSLQAGDLIAVHLDRPMGASPDRTPQIAIHGDKMTLEVDNQQIIFTKVK
jgi:hypothetical protein